MATVKGDVHDIGKNIVGVVLGCNDYEVIDLGVMVPAEKILETAASEKVDMIGLSGLITPSLDEMVHVAREMERARLRRPAADRRRDDQPRSTRPSRSRRAYTEPTVHVLDASRAVGVVGALLEPEPPRRRSIARTAPSRSACATLQRARDGRVLPFVQPAERRHAHRRRTPSSRRRVPRRARSSIRARGARAVHRLDALLHRLGAAGKYPAILEDPEQGQAARELFDDGDASSSTRSSTRAPGARAGVYGFWPASRRADGDGARARGTASRPVPHAPPAAGARRRASRSSLADFVAPRDRPRRLPRRLRRRRPARGRAGARFRADHDDYNAIMAKALADRLAEAFAEMLHKSRAGAWYGRTSTLANDELIAEKYRGIRPAAGYPACPDHTESGRSSTCSAPTRRASALTETFAMTPAASVSGLYFAHPEARYFASARSDAIRSRTTPRARARHSWRRALAPPNLAYDPR